MTLLDDTITKITTGKDEIIRILNFDKTDHSFMAQNEKEGS